MDSLQTTIASSEERAEEAQSAAALHVCLAHNAEIRATAMGTQAKCLEKFAAYNACEARRSQSAADSTLFGCLIGIGLATLSAGVAMPLALGGCAAGRAAGGGGECHLPTCAVDQDRVERQTLSSLRLSELPLCGGYAGFAVADWKKSERLGATVERVGQGTTAADIGLDGGDVVVAIDSRKIMSANDVATAISRTRVGATLRVTVVRGELRLPFEASVTDVDADGSRTRAARFGATFGPTTPTVRYADAVEVVRVEGAAAAAGLQVGDIIRGIGGTLVRRRLELHQLMTSMLPGTSVELTLLRDGKTEKLRIVLEPRKGRKGL